tara:strand:+ start:96 stop:701 length:606 start_codon:yes stop_codon:yes gene_type:complete
MGGLGPGLGGTEILVIGLVALLVVGPKDLPVLMRKLGKLMAKARGMANEFRASFDEMARQSELDDLRKEVEALRTNQGIHALGADADAAFRGIRKDLDSGLIASPPPVMTPAPDEWPDAGGAMMPLDPAAPASDPEPAKAPKKTRVSKSAGTAAAGSVKPKATATPATKPVAKRMPAPKPSTPKAPATVKPRASRTKKAEQ